MKKLVTTTIAAGLVAGVAVAEVSTTFDFASAYVYRGATFNDGLVFQPGIEAAGLGLPEAWGSVAVGAWANMDLDDYGGTLTTSEFSEVDIYAAYSLPTFVEGLDLYVGYLDYTYPGATGRSDKEASAGVGYEVSGFYASATYNYGVGGAIQKSAYIEFDLGYGLDFSEDFSGSVDGGFAFADYEGGESGLNDWDIGASLSYALGDVWSVYGSLTYIGQGDEKVLAKVEDGGAYDVEAVGLFGLGADF